MQMKDEVCERLDQKSSVLVYSLDLSTAFDMLHPDTFRHLLRGKIPDDILGMIEEFLTDRKFFVEIGGQASELKHSIGVAHWDQYFLIFTLVPF